MGGEFVKEEKKELLMGEVSVLWLMVGLLARNPHLELEQKAIEAKNVEP